MPIEPKDLLNLAKRLVGESPGAAEADLRRGISTAYYALFHLLIKETTSNFINGTTNSVSLADLQTRVGRVFNHKLMKEVCEKFKSSQAFAPGVREVAVTFMALHEAREKADYDGAAIVEHSDALAKVKQVESAFQSWLTVQSDQSAVAFLQELFCRSIGLKR